MTNSTKSLPTRAAFGKAPVGNEPISLTAGSSAATTVLLRHVTEDGKSYYYTAAYGLSSSALATVTLGVAADWWVLANLPAGLSTPLLDIQDGLWPSGGITPDGDQPPPGTVRS